MEHLKMVSQQQQQEEEEEERFPLPDLSAAPQKKRRHSYLKGECSHICPNLFFCHPSGHGLVLKADGKPNQASPGRGDNLVVALRELHQPALSLEGFKLGVYYHNLKSKRANSLIDLRYSMISNFTHSCLFFRL